MPQNKGYVYISTIAFLEQPTQKSSNLNRGCFRREGCERVNPHAGTTLGTCKASTQTIPS